MNKKRIIEICDILKSTFGVPNLGNKPDPTDEYFFLVLSTKTSYKSFENVFCDLKRAVVRWENLETIDSEVIENVIKPCGLYKIKTLWMKKAAEKMRRDFGSVTLSPLKTMKKQEVEKYLLSLPGVGIKISKALMMYSLDYDVLPVDTHTYRVAYRLGIIKKEIYLRNERGELHKTLEKMIPEGYRKIFHVGAVSLGRQICLPKRPICEKCPLKLLCDFNKKKI
ncbi:MAG: endonuclease III domain-containing protein [Minisyncoccia bacterium]